MGELNLVTGHGGQAHVTAEDIGSFNTNIFGTGQYVLNRGNKFSAQIITNNQIRIFDGDILMQGRLIRLAENTYDDLAIDNGQQGYKRNDLIVVRYQKNTATGVESCALAVIKGTQTEGTPIDPSYVSGDLLNDHDILNEMPLYRVPINGLTVGTLVPLFGTINGIEDLIAEIAKKLNIAQGASNSGKPIIINASGNAVPTNTLSVAHGGTGATDASTARTNLGIGNVGTLSYSVVSEWN